MPGSELQFKKETENMASSNFDNADAKPEFDLGDARTAITGISLNYVMLGDFLVIVNSKPDVIISEEPYLSQMILVEVKSGMYIRRIWNRTVERGEAVTIDQLVDICNHHFFQGNPCIGCPQYKTEEEGQDFVISQTPIPRKISKYCQQVLGSDASNKPYACPECLKLSEGSEQTKFDVVTKCEVKIKSETEDWTDKKMFENNLTNSANDKSIAENTSQACKAFPPSDIDDKGWHEGFLPNTTISEVNRRSCQRGRPRGKSRKLTYGNLIAEAINNSAKKMLLLSGIYAYINKEHQHFKMEEKVWQNAIRHNLSLNPKFEKVPRKMGRGCFWVIKGGQHNIKDIEKEEDSLITENEEGILDAGSSIQPCVTEQNEDITVPNSTKDSIVVNLGGVKKMKCNLCEQEFHKHSLIMHSKEMHGMGVFNCRTCIFKAQFVSEIVKHMQQEHEQIASQEINCPTCKNNFEILALTEHYKECVKVGCREKVPVKCQRCEKVFPSRDSLSSHAKREHGRGKFVCPHCKFKAYFAEDLINHIEERGGHNQNLDISCPCCNNSYPPKEIVHHYKVCLKVHKSKLYYMRPIKCKTCKKVLKGSTCYNSHMLTHMRADGIEESEAKVTLYHYCDKCGQRFNSKQQMIGHIRSVHDQIDYACPECPMTFKTQKKMYEHKKLSHSTEEKFNCKHCGKRFGQVNTARKHEISHENPQFQCRFCSKLLKSEGSLEAHERVHTDEKAFSCKLCSAAFTWKGGLRQHEQGVHKIIGPKGGTGWLKKDKS